MGESAKTFGLNQVGKIAVPFTNIERAIAFYRGTPGMRFLLQAPQEMTRISIIFLAILVSACSIMPKTAEDFRADPFAIHEFAVDGPLIESLDVVVQNLARCHQESSTIVQPAGGNVFIPVSSDIRIRHHVSDTMDSASAEVFFSNVSTRGILQLVDLNRISDGITQVRVYQLNNSTKWSTASKAVEGWFAGNQECYKTN